jgi:hypothetical protein
MASLEVLIKREMFSSKGELRERERSFAQVLIKRHIEFDRKEMNSVMEGQKSGAVRVHRQVEVEFWGEDRGRERERFFIIIN